MFNDIISIISFVGLLISFIAVSYTHLVMSVKRLVYKPTNSYYQVLSSEAFTKHGLNVHGVIFDELHSQPNRELFDVMTKGSGDARTQPLFFLITTAGTDRNSICFEQHQKAVDILEGRKIDTTIYPVIYGIEDTCLLYTSRCV